jgi:undecaprenyl-diphosphatase
VPAWDRRLEGWIVAHRVGVLDPIAQGLSYVGVWSAVWLGIAVAVAVYRRRADVLLVTALAALTASLTTDALKAATGRDRPDVDTLVARPESASFPSGHASTSFACATVLGAFEPRLRVPLYVLAALIAASRTYVGVHYPLDVVAGAAWGLFVGWVVLRALRLRALRRLAAGLRRSRPARPAG